MVVKVLMIAEIELCDFDFDPQPHPAAIDAAAQAHLDAFRESVRPNDYGISLYRADKATVDLVNTLPVDVEEGVYI